MINFEKKSSNDTTYNFEIRPISIKNLTFNNNFISNYKEGKQNINPIENNRIIPKIDENCNISGLIVFINYKYDNSQPKYMQIEIDDGD